MIKKLSLLLLVAMLAVVAVACGSDKEKEESSAKKESAKSEEITVKHKLGETKVKTNPEKVVVFDMGALDTLDKLGVKVAAVPHEGLPKYLSKYEGTTENAGGLKEPDFEKINEIAPDLILISGRQSEAYKELSKIAPTVFVGVDTTKYMESFEENVTLLGKIFDKEEEAAKQLASVEENINALKEKAPTDKTGLIVLSSGGKVSAYGPDSRFGIIHDVFGVPAVDDKLEVSTHGQSISFEYIAEKNPDYLFVVDRDAVAGDGARAKETVENDIVKNTKAFKEGNIIYLDPNYWYLSGGGLESVDAMVKEVSEGIK
ncbi:siderophore ABC transporter substrate-binding protein [Peribacillus sp. YIM B13472]|uniref:ABC transporter solute-binding protein YclQ n=1 Tax=Peribacillus simplex TaxID=1478 RepID=A0A9W4PB30_9BACI|nr:siderophore ABC transporter substrate-binding protein [Peribacillus simplex]MDR4929187.1 siderophore ABC transporter substrate-binding protein [Peribacillus simplex]WHX91045.1 siderophore ABC transporter substrate-binding protein [Peribacillus simplex]CAH0141492.1 putative ABC transporter solute-binding protein YclQ [Peribacillus simplex]